MTPPIETMRVQGRADIEERFHQLAVKAALGTITVAEHRKLERYAALRRVDDPLPRDARVSDYRLRLLRKYLTAFTLGRAGLRVWVNFSRVNHGLWPTR